MRYRRWASWALAANACLAAPSAFGKDGATSRYTNIDLETPQCRQGLGPAEGISCTGLAGWTVNIGFPAIGATLNFTHGRQRSLAGASGDGRLVAIDGLPGKATKVEWRGVVTNGVFEPYAVIIRVLVLDAAQRQVMIEDGSAAPGTKRSQILILTKLAGETSCVVAYVDAQANPNPNDLARKAADGFPASGSCPIAHVEIIGAPSPVLKSYID